MKVAIVISDGVKQIMFTPENDNEKQALKMFSSQDNIELAVKQGNFYDGGKYEPMRTHVNMCQGGYLRAYSDTESIMLVLTPKKAKDLTEV